MICFVIALKGEAEPVIKNMDGVKSYNYCGMTVFRGKLSGKKTAVVVCGVGKVNAAAGTRYAVDTLKAKAVINIGNAGGLNGSLTVGGLYEVKDAVQYDFDLAEINGTEVGRLNEFNETFLPLSALGLYPEKRLGTGDRFNDDKKDYAFLTETLKADLRDMEGCAIVQVCLNSGVKVYSVKAVSDLAGSGSTTKQYLENLNLCAESTEREIKRIFEAAASRGV